ncbi:MAG: type VI secretion system contractile sheath small subunit [Acidobacteriota bacterium]|nr:type VI secretion system contractile sheath small subunit [Acidobacteriota bacterium]
MARGSYQEEIPASRVNIKYVKYVGDASEERELPLKLLLLGNYSDVGTDEAVEDRKRININKNNFADIMKEQKLKLNYSVDNVMDPDAGGIEVNMDVKGLEDFLPENIATKVPELKVLLEVRQLLQDLKGRVVNNAQFRRELDKILQDPKKMEAMKNHLDQIAPLLSAAAAKEDAKKGDAES